MSIKEELKKMAVLDLYRALGAVSNLDFVTGVKDKTKVKKAADIIDNAILLITNL